MPYRFGRAVCLPLALAVVAWWAGTALAQGPEFGAPKKAKASDGDSQDGLESATPKDSLNEFGGNGSSGPTPAGDTGGEADFPAANDANGGNSLFGDTPVNTSDPGKTAAGGVSASGGDAPPPKNATGSAPTNQSAAPASAAKPADAEALLKQVNGGGNAPAPASAVPAPAPASVAPAVNTPASSSSSGSPAVGTTAAVDGQAELIQKSEAPPPITAPPLPPPNDFAGAPPVPGTMRLMAEGEAPEEYVVQPGDTLFDICDQLLDEAGYWPKLWALNPEIKNPHFIFPNMKLRFYPGDDENPPYLQVITEDDVIPIDKGDLDEEDLIAEKVNFVPDEALQEQVAEVVGPEGVEALEDAILTGGGMYQGGQIQLQVPGFIYAEERDELGFVIGGRSSEITVAPGQQALIEGVGGLTAGMLYTVLRPGEEIEDPESGERIGYKYYFIANMRIDSALDDAAFLGTALDNRLQVMPNDIIVNYISTKRMIPLDNAVGALSSIDASVVGFDYLSQELGGQGHYAFIDKGNSDGVAPGMYLPIYTMPGYPTSAFSAGDLPADYEYIGVIRIIDTTDAGACGYVVRNIKEIRLGDRTTKG